MFRNRRNNVLLFGSRRLFSAKKIVLTQTKWRINGMKKVGIFMADGCEEIEGLTVVDIVRRAKLEMTTISITDKKEVTSSHNVTFLTDALASEVDFDGFDAIVLPGGMPGNMNNIMKQAQKMQKQMEQAQAELESSEYTATSGGGAVEVTISGTKEITKIKLDPEVVDPDDIEMLEDLVMAAVNEAIRKMDEMSTQKMSKITGGLGGLF